MADLEKIVKLIFDGDGTKLNTELSKMDRQFGDFTDKIQDVTGPIGDFGVKVAKAELALIAFGAAGLVYAYDKAKDFEGGVIELDKVLSDEEGLTGGLDLAKNKAVEFSDKYGESSKNVISSIADFKQANFSLAESIDLAEQAMRLKIAGDLEAAESSQFLKQILSGFKAEATDATVVIDSMNAVSNKYNTNVRELAIGMGDLSGVAKTVNMTYAETEGVLTPVIAVFGSGSEAANALKTGLIRLVDNTPATVKAMESIGVSQRGANGELKNAYDILEEVSRAFENTDKSQQLFIAGEIFGKEQAAKMVQVLSDWDQVLAVTETALNSTGSAQLEVEKRLLSAEVAVSRAIVGWENLNIAIGGKFAQSATGTINAFTDIENALRGALGQETFDVVWDAINGFFNDTTALFKDIAKNLPEALDGVDFSGLVDAFKSLGVEIGNALDSLFGGDLDLTIVEGLQSAVQKIVDIAQKMTEFTTGFVKGLDPLLTTIGKITTGITNMDTEGAEMAGHVSGWAKSIDVFTSGLRGLEIALYAIATTSTISAIPAIVAFGVPILAVTAALVSAGTSAYILAKGLNAIGLVDDKTILQIESSIRSVGDTFDFTADKIEARKVKPTLLPISTQDTEDAFWGVNQGIKGLEDNPIKIDVDTDPAVAGLELIFSDEIWSDGKRVNIWTEFEDMSFENVQSQMEDLKGPIETEIIIDGVAYKKFEDGISEATKPVEKPVEVKPTILEQAKLDLERELNYVDNTAKTLQSAFEWKAKIDIAEIEAAAETTKAAFDSIGASVVEVSSGVADMFGSLAGNLEDMSFLDKTHMMDILKEQQEEQNKLIESQIELTKQQSEYMRLKNEKIESGDTSEIKIDSTGLEPALEMVMWQIIEKVQIRANENAQEFLLGLPSV